MVPEILKRSPIRTPCLLVDGVFSVNLFSAGEPAVDDRGCISKYLGRHVPGEEPLKSQP